MSIASKATFGLCFVVSVGIIGYVHYKQAYDRKQLRLGITRDIERQERRKAENVYILQQQIELAKELRKKQAIEGDNT
ncbi:PREDICTED: protein PET117 homolog, mitochondrial [Dinoponera quadriceps]|uniref:Protein PET117 homolog, mitochondrial n=1 Tax=Dinoponera quadriceps TaxID=609295 RepID=A0A6P3XJC5_DINQU|nr:PREDICTED: protein PET117 homolog, mitochondrial [Dinoponera quadriceps]